MKLRGGYQPTIFGRPSGDVSDLPVPDTLGIELRQFGLSFAAAVKDGESVAFGAPLAWADVPGGRIALPAPAFGTVARERAHKDRPGKIILAVTDAQPMAVHAVVSPERMTAEAMRRRLAESGIWPLVYSSKTGGMPPLDVPAPRRIIVNCVLAEPFRARGKTVLANDRERVLAGLRFLPRLLGDRGVVHLVITNPTDPVARDLIQAASEQACMRVETVPVRYPVEDARLLGAALDRADGMARRDDDIWTLDVQAVGALGACMAEGLPLYERLVALGGPAMNKPRHVRVRIGTALEVEMASGANDAERLMLRGGLMKGRPAEAEAAVRYDDDAFFGLPRAGQREFLGFVNPGADRVSILPCFLSWLTGAPDRHVSATLRGERRPCIACGLCETVCPAGLLPQVLHRYLYRDALDEAERTGLPRCIGCGLCSYVCPSKIELVHQFDEARARLSHEHGEPEGVPHARAY